MRAERWWTLLAALGWLVFFAATVFIPVHEDGVPVIGQVASILLGVVILMVILLAGERPRWSMPVRLGMFITGVLAVVLTGDFAMGVAVTFSMLVGVACAAGLGTLLPIVCERMNIDPAVSSGPYVTMANDLLGLLIYFAVASLLLIGTT